VNTAISDLKDQLVKASTKASALGLMPKEAGNFSARDRETGRIFITPTQFPYEDMTAEDIVEVDDWGRLIEGKHTPSSEAPVHCAVYRHRPDVFGVVHTEPVYVNVFGALGRPIEPVVVGLLASVGGAVPVFPFHLSGSDEFAQGMLEAMGDGYAVIWANHGLLTVGHSLDVALERAIFTEHSAKIQYLAQQMGTPHILPLDLLGKVAV
jgi:ribulose-5-phosphate 4-epimerase/fuculose-1-phosphate aldolase